jgi:hypothetical protein
MATVSLATMYPEMQLFLPTCSEPLITSMVNFASIEFCECTLLWWGMVPPQLCIAGGGLLPIVPPDGAGVAGVHEVYIEGVPIKPTGISDLARSHTNWAEMVGTPQGFFTEGNSVRLVPTNAADIMVACRVAYKPQRGSLAIPDWLYEDWWEVIKAGALARLMVIPGQSWTNPGLASTFRREFDTGCREAKIEANKNRTSASLRVRYNPA